MPICRIKLKSQFSTVVLVFVYLIHSHLLSNVLSDIKDETITQLTQANSLLVDAMHNLQLAYSNSGLVFLIQLHAMIALLVLLCRAQG